MRVREEHKATLRDRIYHALGSAFARKGRRWAFGFGAMRCINKGPVPGVVSFVLLAGLLLAGGCTTFRHAWAKAAEQPVATNSLLSQQGFEPATIPSVEPKPDDLFLRRVAPN